MEQPNHSQAEPDYSIKILLIGEPESGKTSFLRRFANEPFLAPREDYPSTLTVDFRAKIITDPETNKRIKIQLWDTSSINRVRGALNTSYRGADGLLYLVDVTSSKSLDEMLYWFKTVNQDTIDNVKIVIAASKTDDLAQRQVSNEQILDAIRQGQEQKEEWRNTTVQFIEISSKNDHNIMEAINLILRSLKLDSQTAAATSNKKDREKCIVM